MNELSEEQLEALERLLKNPSRVTRLIVMADEDEKKEWLFTLIRKSAAWVAAVLGASILFWESFIKFLRGLVE